MREYLARWTSKTMKVVKHGSPNPTSRIDDIRTLTKPTSMAKDQFQRFLFCVHSFCCLPIIFTSSCPINFWLIRINVLSFSFSIESEECKKNLIFSFFYWENGKSGTRCLYFKTVQGNEKKEANNQPQLNMNGFDFWLVCSYAPCKTSSTEFSQRNEYELCVWLSLCRFLLISHSNRKGRWKIRVVFFFISGAIISFRYIINTII